MVLQQHISIAHGTEWISHGVLYYTIRKLITNLQCSLKAQNRVNNTRYKLTRAHGRNCAKRFFPPSIEYTVRGRCYHGPILQMRKLTFREFKQLSQITQIVSGRAGFRFSIIMLFYFLPLMWGERSYKTICLPTHDSLCRHHHRHHWGMKATQNS